MAMKRPIKKRIWFYKPWPGYLKGGFLREKGWWKPWGAGGDEFNWHTIHIGHPVIGMLHFAVKPCPMTGDCAELADEDPMMFLYDWPVDAYGHNHEGPCTNRRCYCQEVWQ